MTGGRVISAEERKAWKSSQDWRERAERAEKREAQTHNRAEALTELIASLVMDWADKCCDRPDECACTMAQAVAVARSRDEVTHA